MSLPPNYRYLLGAQGWDHAAWTAHFYPEDLPADWRLSFYNTEFECVYLPPAFWQQQSDAALLSWQQDTLPHFRFLLVRPPPAMDRQAEGAEARALDLLGEKAVLVDRPAPQIRFIPTELDLRQFAQALQSEQAIFPQYLISLEADLAQLQKVRTLLHVLGY